jgi:hypothetical protein
VGGSHTGLGLGDPIIYSQGRKPTPDELQQRVNTAKNLGNHAIGLGGAYATGGLPWVAASGFNAAHSAATGGTPAQIGVSASLGYLLRNVHPGLGYAGGFAIDNIVQSLDPGNPAQPPPVSP